MPLREAVLGTGYVLARKTMSQKVIGHHIMTDRPAKKNPCAEVCVCVCVCVCVKNAFLSFLACSKTFHLDDSFWTFDMRWSAKLWQMFRCKKLPQLLKIKSRIWGLYLLVCELFQDGSLWEPAAPFTESIRDLGDGKLVGWGCQKISFVMITSWQSRFIYINQAYCTWRTWWFSHCKAAFFTSMPFHLCFFAGEVGFKHLISTMVPMHLFGHIAIAWQLKDW